jgi:hypothetical protein
MQLYSQVVGWESQKYLFNHLRVHEAIMRNSNLELRNCSSC